MADWGPSTFLQMQRSLWQIQHLRLMTKGSYEPSRSFFQHWLQKSQFSHVIDARMVAGPRCEGSGFAFRMAHMILEAGTLVVVSRMVVNSSVTVTWVIFFFSISIEGMALAMPVAPCITAPATVVTFSIGMATARGRGALPSAGTSTAVFGHSVFGAQNKTLLVN